MLWLQIQPYTQRRHRCSAKAFVHVLFSELVMILHHSYKTREVLLFRGCSKKTRRNRSKAGGLPFFLWETHGVSSTLSNPPGSPQKHCARRGWAVACSSFLTHQGVNPPACSGPQPPKMPLYSHREKLFSSALQNDVPLKVSLPKVKHQKTAGLPWDILEAKSNFKVQFCGDLLNDLPPAKPQQETN